VVECQNEKGELMIKTKIVATIGPASEKVETLREMMRNGLSVARINFSHGIYEEHKMRMDAVREAARLEGVAMPIMLDTKGPEIRLGTFKEPKVELKEGATFTLTSEAFEGTAEKAHVNYAEIAKVVKVGDPVLLNDGIIVLKAKKIEKKSVVCDVIVGGITSNRKKVNLPLAKLTMPFLSQRDIEDIKYGISVDVDMIAASFVRRKEDVMAIRKLLKDNNAEHIEIISKIENPEGVENLDEIIEVSDGIMVARGDLGVEMSPEMLPHVQKLMIKKCIEAGKNVITATEMLESMITNTRPTRAETSDVANAVYDMTGAVMLSGETAVGHNPVLVVKTMAAICQQTEQNIKYKKRFNNKIKEIKNVTDSIAVSTCQSSHDLNAKAIITPSQTGATAKLISRFRTPTQIIAVTSCPRIQRKLGLVWGVETILINEFNEPTASKQIEKMIELAIADKLVKKGDLVVVTAGLPIGKPGTTNMLRIQNA